MTLTGTLHLAARTQPDWVCSDCGQRHGRKLPHMATWHKGVCGVCGAAQQVTEPRDYGYLTKGWLKVGQTVDNG